MSAQGVLPRPGRASRRTPLPTSKQDFAFEVLRALAQSFGHDVPPGPALNGLLEGPWFRGPSLRASQARNDLRLFIADIEEGVPVGTALMRHYSKALPRHVLEAVVRAEDNDRLSSVLPVLCEVLTGDPKPYSRFRTALLYPVMQLALALTLLSGLLVFIVPKFGKMYDEMLPGVPLRGPVAVLVGLTETAGLVFTGFWLLVCTVVLVKVVAPVIRGYEPALSLAEKLLKPVPFAGPMMRLRGDLEIHQSMAALVAAGMDVPQAAEQAAQLVKSPDAARRLIRFFRESHGGKPWVDAWQISVRPAPLCEFLVRNAAARQDPAGGFARGAQSVQTELEHRIGTLARWIEPAGILFNSLLVALFMYAFMGTLFTLTWHLL